MGADWIHDVPRATTMCVVTGEKRPCCSDAVECCVSIELFEPSVLTNWLGFSVDDWGLLALYSFRLNCCLNANEPFRHLFIANVK